MKNQILLMLVLGFTSLLFSQVSNYTFAEGTGIYTPLENYSVSSAAGDNANEILSIPFTFTYNDIAYTSLCVVTNGFVRMGTTSTTSFSNSLSATAAARLDVLAPLWDDLYDDASSEIRYGTIGSEPNRVFVIEWNGVLWNTSIGTPQHFQLHLYETTNNIVFSYNLQEPGGYASATIGINATPGGSGNYLSVSPGNPSATSSNSSNNAINSVSDLPTGKWYQFSPPDPNAPPAPAILVGPSHESINNLEYTSLRWQTGSGNTDGYKLYIGTEQPLTYIGDLGSATTYNHSELFAFDTTYFWQVVPYNAINVEAENCPVWSFSIRPNALVQTFPITWDFGTSFSDPFPPTNWSKHSGVLNDPTFLGTNGSGAWSQYIWCNNYGLDNVAAGTDIYGQDTSWLISPPIAVSANDLEVTFDLAYMAAGTQSLPPESGGWDDMFAVLIGDGISWSQVDVARLWDNQGSANILDQISPSGMYVSIPLGIPGTKYIAFYAQSSEWNVSNSLMIDNVMIRTSPVDPILQVSPTAVAFGDIPLGTSSDWTNLYISNIGGGSLELSQSNFSLIGTDAVEFGFSADNLPVVLQGGQSVIVPVYFSPLSVGEKSAVLVIDDSVARTQLMVTLSGFGFELILDIPEVMISVDGDEIMLEWDVIDGANSYQIYTTLDPTDEDSWILETVTADPFFTFWEDQVIKFYRVVASTEFLD